MRLVFRQNRARLFERRCRCSRLSLSSESDRTANYFFNHPVLTNSRGRCYNYNVAI